MLITDNHILCGIHSMESNWAIWLWILHPFPWDPKVYTFSALSLLKIALCSKLFFKLCFQVLLPTCSQILSSSLMKMFIWIHHLHVGCPILCSFLHVYNSLKMSSSTAVSTVPPEDPTYTPCPEPPHSSTPKKLQPETTCDLLLTKNGRLVLELTPNRI